MAAPASIFERWLQRRLAARRRLLRWGVGGATAFVVAQHMLLSFAVGMVLAWTLGLDARGFRIMAAASMGIPLLLLTPFVHTMMRLLRDADAAHAQAQRLAVTDELTQVSNRRHFMDAATLLVEQAHRQQSPLTMAAIDIDHFKRVNDTQGHEAGDRALVRVAALLRDSHRGYDLLARVGGDEFALLMPGADRAVALATLERLRHSAAGDLQLPTLSIGVAVLPTGEDLGALRRHADAALYAAKERGRNCIAVHVGGGTAPWVVHHGPGRDEAA